MTEVVIPRCPTRHLTDENAREWVDFQHAIAKRLLEALVDVACEFPRNSEGRKLAVDTINEIERTGWLPDRVGEIDLKHTGTKPAPQLDEFGVPAGCRP